MYVCVCVFKPTQHFDKLLHVEVEGVNDGTSGLVVMVIDGDGGETTSNLPLLKHIHLDLGPKVLPQEMGRGAASYPRPDHRWSTENQKPKSEIRVRFGCEMIIKHILMCGFWVFKDMASLQMVNMCVDSKVIVLIVFLQLSEATHHSSNWKEECRCETIV